MDLSGYEVRDASERECLGGNEIVRQLSCQWKK